jgi:hypothetical protein
MNAQEKGLPAPHSADCRVDFLDVKAAILNGSTVLAISISLRAAALDRRPGDQWRIH